MNYFWESNCNGTSVEAFLEILSFFKLQYKNEKIKISQSATQMT